MAMVYRKSTSLIVACERMSSNNNIFPDRDVDSAKGIEVHQKLADREVTLQLIPDWHQAIKSGAPLFNVAGSFKRGFSVRG
jgi:hypothetical protein